MNGRMGEPPGVLGRRRFLDILFGGGLAALAGAVLYPILYYLVPPKVKEVTTTSVVAGKASDLAANAGKIVAFGGKPAIIMRTPEGELRAFTAVCTHLACTVQYRPDLKHIWCACHDGHYDLHGQVLAGPPPRPLDEFKVTVRGDDLILSRG
ncbi:MAG TPA: Rieske (2Fe-2S) protein [bacterium]